MVVTRPAQVIEISSSSSESETKQNDREGGPPITGPQTVSLISSDSDDDANIVVPAKRIAELRDAALRTIQSQEVRILSPQRPPLVILRRKNRKAIRADFVKSESTSLNKPSDRAIEICSSDDEPKPTPTSPADWQVLIQERLKTWQGSPSPKSDVSSDSSVLLKSEDDQNDKDSTAESSSEEEVNPAGLYNEWAKWRVDCCPGCHGLCNNIFSISLPKLIFPEIRTEQSLIQQIQKLSDNPVIWDQRAPPQRLLKAEFMMPVISPVSQLFLDKAKDFARLVEFQGASDLTEAELQNLFGPGVQL